jgi:hypothetical protein
VTGAALGVLKKNASREMGVFFFDIGGSNMTTLFHRHKDVFGVSQLPYYQAALTVFLSYLRVISKAIVLRYI